MLESVIEKTFHVIKFYSSYKIAYLNVHAKFMDRIL